VRVAPAGVSRRLNPDRSIGLMLLLYRTTEHSQLRIVGMCEGFLFDWVGLYERFPNPLYVP